MKKNKSKKSFIIASIILGILIISIISFGIFNIITVNSITGKQIDPISVRPIFPIIGRAPEPGVPCIEAAGGRGFNDPRCEGIGLSPLNILDLLRIQWQNTAAIDRNGRFKPISLAGKGNAYACANSDGGIYRSKTPCVGGSIETDPNIGREDN